MTTCRLCRKLSVPTMDGETAVYGGKVWVCLLCSHEGDYHEVAREASERDRDREEENQRRDQDNPPRPIDRFGG